MGGRSALNEIVRQARGRHISQIILEQGLFALSMALGGLLVLFLTGTQVLSAAWLAAIFGVSLIVGLYRAKSKIQSPYQIAQRLDHRLNLNDRLSTALYFQDHAGETQALAALIEEQRSDAERAARLADVKAGIPFLLPRSAYTTCGLAVAALSLFAIRYGVTRSLDLRPSLVQIAFNGLIGVEDVAAKKKPGGPKADGVKPKESALAVDPWESKTQDQQGPSDEALNTVDDPNPNNPDLKTEANAKANGTQSKDPVDQPGESAGDSDKTPSGADQMAENAASPDHDGGKQGKQQPGAQQQEKPGPNSSGENSSLADKMRDALSNLMAKLKMQQKPGEGKQGSQQSQQGSQSAQQRQGKDEKGGQQQQGKQSDAMSSPDQQGDQDGQSSDKAASAQSKSGSKNSDKPPSQDGKSGIGKEDGDKSAREAEQLSAMGKISEIIGKRAANMTGEVMIEVASGKQQLKTQYSQKKAAHADAGGDVNRDEVPLAYQQFVQQYFEEIHKPSAAPKAKKNPGS